jgi:uncharacterized protein (DUF58 family)
VRIDVQIGGAWAELGKHGGELSLTVGRRGAHRLGATPVRLRDALGITRRRLLLDRSERFLVLPRPDVGAHVVALRGTPADDVELDGLAPYAPGIPIARIHWRTLARGVGLYARRVVPPADGLPLIVVEAGADLDADAVDRTARFAAGQIMRLARSGGCRVLLPGDRAPTTVRDLGRHWRAVHRRLALLEAASAPSAASA